MVPIININITAGDNYQPLDFGSPPSLSLIDVEAMTSIDFYYIESIALTDTIFVSAYGDYNTEIYVRVGEIVNDVITWRTDETEITGSTAGIFFSIARIDSTHFIIAYEGATYAGTLKIGTYDGSLSMSGEYDSGLTGMYEFDVAVFNSDYFVMSYRMGAGPPASDRYGRTKIGYFGDMTFGTEYSNGITSENIKVDVLDSTHFIQTNKTYVRVGERSGTDITFGTAVAFTSATQETELKVMNSTSFIITYHNESGMDLVKGTVSGTSITLTGHSALFRIPGIGNGISTYQIDRLDDTHFASVYTFVFGLLYSNTTMAIGNTDTLSFECNVTLDTYQTSGDTYCGVSGLTATTLVGVGGPMGAGNATYFRYNPGIVGDPTEFPDAKMHFPQYPDPFGWDVDFCNITNNNWYLADDWMCNESGYITDIHFWISSYNDTWENATNEEILDNITTNGVYVYIFSDVPGPPYSHPNDLLYESFAYPLEHYFDVNVSGPYYGDEGWYTIEDNYSEHNHELFWRVDLTNFNTSFYQENGTVYWLSLGGITGSALSVGWKTSADHFNDNAFYGFYDEEEGYVGYPLYDPITYPEPIDFAFVITGETEEPEIGDPIVFNNSKMTVPQYPDPHGWDVSFDYMSDDKRLADDWLCNESGDVTGIHFWISWYNDSIDTIPNITVSIYPDVPAEGEVYSHPDDVPLWEWTFTDFNITGPFSSPQGWLDPTGSYEEDNHELYYRIDINKIPAPFYQEYGTVYWLSIQMPLEQIGWKTSQDHFNDASVYKQGDIIWDNGNWALNWLSSQWDLSVPMNSQSADDFNLTEETNISSYRFWFGSQPIEFDETEDFYIYIYADDGTGNSPTGAGMNYPETTALASYNITITPVEVWYNGVDAWVYDCYTNLTPVFHANASTKYWIVPQYQGNYAIDGRLARLMTSDTLTLHQAKFGEPFTFGYPFWVDLSEMGFEPTDFAFKLYSNESADWKPLSEPIEPYDDIDFAFVLTNEEYSDHTEFTDIKMSNPQYPNPFGWDVYQRYLADDWMCNETGDITDIHFWISTQNDARTPEELKALLNETTFYIWEDVPVPPENETPPGEGGDGPFILVLQDTYGDGWGNGGGSYIDVSINGTPIYTDLTIIDGYGPEIYFITVNTSDSIFVNYTSGSYPEENVWFLMDNAGTHLFDEVGSSDNEIHDHTVIASPIAGFGTGTEEDPYQITNVTELNLVKWLPDDYYILLNDIDMGGEGTFIAIGTYGQFNGSFDGLNHSINNVLISGGFFGTVNGVVKNLGLDISSGTGSLIGTNRGTVTNCHASGQISSGNSDAGLITYNNGTVAQCYSLVDVSGSSGGNYHAGLIAYNDIGGIVTDCYSRGDVDGEYRASGLIGYNDGTVTDCYSTSPVSFHGLGDFVYGLMEYNGGTVTNCYWDVNTSGTNNSNAGVGRTTAEMTYPYESYDPPCTGLYEGWDLANKTGGAENSIWIHDKINQNDYYPIFREGYEFYSHPGSSLWEKSYLNCEINLAGPFNGSEGTYVPEVNYTEDDHFTFYRVDLINFEGEFSQVNGTVYWFGMNASAWGDGIITGWKTSVDYFNDVAVYDLTGEGNWVSLRDPITMEQLAFSFVITGEAGPEFGDNTTFPGAKMHFPQYPDPFGWDVDWATGEQGWFLGDDWMCNFTGTITDLHFWVSSFSDMLYPEDISSILNTSMIMIWDNNPGMGYSYPNNPLWMLGNRTITIAGPYYGDEGWLVPDDGYFEHNHQLFWRVDIDNITDPFVQENNTIYWLVIHAPVIQNMLGWKTSQNHFMDDAVYGTPGMWYPLTNPVPPFESLDFAFVITGEYLPQQTTFYVDQQFNASTPGWHVNCWNVIHEAVENASAGYLILVNGDGDSYAENVYINKSIDLRGNYTTTRPRINGTNAFKSTIEVISDWVNISGFYIYNAVGKVNNYHGIAVGKTQFETTDQYNVTVSDCLIRQANGGVYLRGGGYCTVNDSEIGTGVTTGIFCMYDHHTFDDNYIHDCMNGIDAQYAYYNVISNNIVSSNTQIGVKLTGAGTNNCSVYTNNVTSNGGYGVSIGNGCRDTLVYHNNFVNNNGVGIQAFDYGSSLRNSWNLSYPSCGNYWDDHGTQDIYSGPEQNFLTSDGICDLHSPDPYNITTGVQDYYPFFSPFNGTLPPAWNAPPIASDEDPMDEDTGIDVNYAQVSIDISDDEGDSFNVFIHGIYLTNVSLNDQTNGTFTATLNTPLPPGTLIPWYVYLQSNGSSISWNNYSFSFTTLTPNRPPNVPTNESPANNSQYVTINSYLSVMVTDPDNDAMDVIFYWGNGTEIGVDWDVANNTQAIIYLPDYVWMSHDTDYSWYVMVYDTSLYSNASAIWNFTTCKNYDLNGDGNINYLDVSSLVSHYGQSIPQATQHMTLRPVGDTFLLWTPSPPAPANFLNVMEIIPDDPNTFVWNTPPGWFFPECYFVGTPSYTYTIINVTLNARMSSLAGGGVDAFQHCIFNGGPLVFQYGPPMPIMTAFPSFQTYSFTFANDPYGGDWTWAKLAVYVFGVDQLGGMCVSPTQMTQFNVDVYYNTPGSEPYDINGDGIVNYLDISSLVFHYGETY
jgi:parallel beta-helix repeat protein